MILNIWIKLIASICWLAAPIPFKDVIHAEQEKDTLRLTNKRSITPRNLPVQYKNRVVPSTQPPQFAIRSGERPASQQVKANVPGADYSTTTEF